MTDRIPLDSVCMGMMKLAWVCLLFGCAAKPAVAAPPQSRAVLFEIDTNDLRPGPEQNVVYTDGTWQLDRTGEGRSSGRLSAAELTAIEKDVSAPWSTSPRTGITCHMVHAPTNYSANGRIVYTDSGCESPVLDEVSAKALAEILATLTIAESR